MYSEHRYRRQPQRLTALLKTGHQVGFIFTTIQKFTPGEEEVSCSIRSGTISCYLVMKPPHTIWAGSRLNKKGEYEYGYAKHMRDGLPNATFIAFTGTPVSRPTVTRGRLLAQTFHVYIWNRRKRIQAS